MNRPAILAFGLGKRYLQGFDGGASLFARFRGRRQGMPMWALRHCSFKVRRGELIGLIGSNGAGKSTLLKILSRITRPNEGHAQIYGRVGSLLEVGTGFHSELTGRENVYLNGALIGMPKSEIRRKFDQIIEFAGVAEWVDIPIKRYSSGMKVRLAFAVAAHLEQEIMLIDEVLAVGDSAFRVKCFEKIQEVARQGRTVVLVSHELPSLATTCGRAIWLAGGSVRRDGDATDVIDSYLGSVIGCNGLHRGFVMLKGAEGAISGVDVRLKYLRLVDGANKQVPCFASGQRAKFALGYETNNPGSLREFAVSLAIFNLSRQPVTICDSDAPGKSMSDFLPTSGEFVCEFPTLPLVP